MSDPEQEEIDPLKAVIWRLEAEYAAATDLTHSKELR